MSIPFFKKNKIFSTFFQAGGKSRKNSAAEAAALQIFNWFSR